MTKTLDENKAACMYDGRQMTVSQYMKQREVKIFEEKLKKLAYQSALCDSKGRDIRTGETYAPLKDGFPTHQHRRCLTFEKGVLPTDAALEADYWNVFEGGKVTESVIIGECKRCKQEYVKPARNTQYCLPCRDEVERARKRQVYHASKKDVE